ncbi:amidohydrolase family protein [Planctomycetota bacterium]
MKSNSKYFPELRAYLETVPLIDCHDHSRVCGPKYTDPMSILTEDYLLDDLHSASSDSEIEIIKDTSLGIEQRWPVFEKAWKRTCHTGCAQVTKLALKKFYGIEELTLDALKRVESNPLRLDDEKVFEDILDQANIVVRLEDVVGEIDEIKQVVDGTLKITPRGRLVVHLTPFTEVCDHDTIQKIAGTIGKTVSTLDEYVNICKELFEAYKRFGIVAFKNASAYVRTLKYDAPDKAKAEKTFNMIMSGDQCDCEQLKPLSDYLFHQAIQTAREMELPIQIHTGHLAEMRNDIVRANAIGLTEIIDTYRDVRFDLFHANWPYSGEILFLAKNYPNAAIDFCWANMLDPVYCQNMFKQVVSSVPHGKIHGYGSDFSGFADRAWAHASIAKDNIAIALADMADIEYITEAEAKQIAYDWLFANPNKFYNLGL